MNQYVTECPTCPNYVSLMWIESAWYGRCDNCEGLIYKTKEEIIKTPSITFSQEAAPFVWEAIAPSIKDTSCPFCGNDIIDIHEFAGGFIYNNDLRFIHNSLPCLVEYINIKG